VKLRYLPVICAAILCLVVFPTRARADKGDVYFGYSRTGANLYTVYTPGINGWQAAAHFKPLPFIGIEGDISHYSQHVNGSSQQVTLVMFGPRVTVHALGFSVFAHGLGGAAHQHETVTNIGSAGYNATSYAFGGGVDIPVVLGLKLRATGDYLGNSMAPSGSYSPSHYRFGVGAAYHF
jgi:opacity protein-like surface antigen